jgi:hypothetical protein
MFSITAYFPQESNSKTNLSRYKNFVENLVIKVKRDPFEQYPDDWIRICVAAADPDPGEPNQCGSTRIRIRDTALKKGEKNC